MDEFSFVENEDWFKLFINELKRVYGNNVSFKDALEFAIHNVDILFRKTCFNIGEYDDHDWLICTSNIYKNSRLCRISYGFGGRRVPSNKKFNPIFHDKKYKKEINLASYSYSYLTFHNEIKIMLTTPMSDYTRYSDDNSINRLDKLFITCLRLADQKPVNQFCKTDKNGIQINIILDAYRQYNESIKSSTIQ